MAQRRDSPAEPLRVIDLHFNDIPDPASWFPEDSTDVAEWITITVGDESGGCNYQVHICTPTSIKHLSDKRACFMIDAWAGVDDLVRRLDAFIAQRTADGGDAPDRVLARYWLWEYAGM